MEIEWKRSEPESKNFYYEVVRLLETELGQSVLIQLIYNGILSNTQLEKILELVDHVNYVDCTEVVSEIIAYREINADFGRSN